MPDTNKTMKIKFPFGYIYCEVVYDQNTLQCVKIKWGVCLKYIKWYKIQHTVDIFDHDNQE